MVLFFGCFLQDPLVEKYARPSCSILTIYIHKENLNGRTMRYSLTHTHTHTDIYIYIYNSTLYILHIVFGTPKTINLNVLIII
jgi:hypothetical protein